MIWVYGIAAVFGLAALYNIVEGITDIGRSHCHAPFGCGAGRGRFGHFVLGLQLVVFGVLGVIIATAIIVGIIWCLGWLVETLI